MATSLCEHCSWCCQHLGVPCGTSGCGSGGRGAAPFPFQNKVRFDPSALSPGMWGGEGLWGW